jgi:CRISPR-associated protein Cas5h
MQQAISFILSGKTACFRKPDVNQFAYFTYNNIHKPALLGLLGAIIGLGGYTQNYRKYQGFPEFYEKLKDLKVSIIPLAKNGYFSKNIQVFNNTVGYASKEQGGNLIVREQWIENPKWQIMLLDIASNEYNKIKDYLEQSKAVFIPYLGKNDHPANISDVQIINLSESIEDKIISSLFIEDSIELSKAPRGELSYFFKEIAPMSLHDQYHYYEYASLVFTNGRLKNIDNEFLFSYEEENYMFI